MIIEGALSNFKSWQHIEYCALPQLPGCLARIALVKRVSYNGF